MPYPGKTLKVLHRPLVTFDQQGVKIWHIKFELDWINPEFTKVRGVEIARNYHKIQSGRLPIGFRLWVKEAYLSIWTS